MKKLIVTACAAIASAVALASTVESSNVFGVLKVDTENTSNTKKQFMISVPWVAVGTGGAIDPEALVLASKLDQGDMLYVYGAVASGDTTHQFGAWTVSSSKEWTTAGVSASADSIYTTGDSTTVSRGVSLVVETAQQYIYLSGQYADVASDVTINPATGTGKDYAPAYTLIGGNFANDLDVNSMTVKEGNGVIHPRDEIRLSLETVYTRNNENNAWQKTTDGTQTITLSNGETRTIPATTTQGVTIPQGKGAWYIRRGTGALTLTMPAAASASAN